MSELEKIDFSAEIERLRKMAPQQGSAVDDAESAIQRIEVRRKSLGIPRRVFDALQNANESQPPLMESSAWLGARESLPGAWCLTLSGPKGCGKSVGAGYLLNKIAGTRGSGPTIWDGGTRKNMRSWWTASELAGCGVYSGELSALCEHSGPLVLDDLGSEYADAKGFFSQILDRLIDARYREYAPTIITTNLNAKSFGERYGERVIDRLREGGRFVEFGGVESMRGK